MDTYVTKQEFEATMATVTTKSEVKEAVQDLEFKMMRRFDNLTGKFEEFKTEITTKFDKLEAKVDSKFQLIDTKFSQIMKKLSK